MGVAREQWKPPSWEEIAQLRQPVRDVNADHQEQMTRLERMATFMSDHVGTPGFFFIVIVWTIFWLSWNLLAPKHLKFDPPMAFVFWLFISNMVQIFLMPLIMVAQNLQTRHAELRAQSDYEVNLKAEREVAAVLRHLEYQNEMLRALVQKLVADREGRDRR
jgi:uncharacterized membrane protein